MRPCARAAALSYCHPQATHAYNLGRRETPASSNEETRMRWEDRMLVEVARTYWCICPAPCHPRQAEDNWGLHVRCRSLHPCHLHSAAAAACQGGHCHRAGWRCRQHLLCGGGRHLHSAQHPGEGQLLPWLALVPCTSCEWIVDTSFQSCRHCCETVTGKGTCGMCF